MSKKVKVYSHDGTMVKVIEVSKAEGKQFKIGYRHGWFNSYEDAKEDLEFNKRIEFIVGDSSKLEDTVKSIEKYVTTVGDEFVELHEELKTLKRKLKSGLDLLLDRIKENSGYISDLNFDHTSFVQEVRSERDYTAKQEETKHYTYIVLILISIALSITALVN